MAGNETKTSMTVVAVGPGDPTLLTLRGQQALREADLVVGLETVLEVVEPWTKGADVRPMSNRDQEEVLEEAAAQAGQGRRPRLGIPSQV
mgnify:CR=1 FL=1